MGPPAWTVDVEVVLISVADGQVCFRTVAGPLSGHASPDEAALALAGLDPDGGGAGTVSHSTSWRTPAPGRVRLTYAVAPDPAPQAAVPLIAPSIVCSLDPLRPAPPVLHEHHVAAHAVRHLAFLADTDPTVRQAAAQAPLLWSAVRRASLALPVAEHDAAHELASARSAGAAPAAPLR